MKRFPEKYRHSAIPRLPWIILCCVGVAALTACESRDASQDVKLLQLRAIDANGVLSGDVVLQAPDRILERNKIGPLESLGREVLLATSPDSGLPLDSCRPFAGTLLVPEPSNQPSGGDSNPSPPHELSPSRDTRVALANLDSGDDVSIVVRWLAVESNAENNGDDRMVPLHTARYDFKKSEMSDSNNVVLEHPIDSRPNVSDEQTPVASKPVLVNDTGLLGVCGGEIQGSEALEEDGDDLDALQELNSALGFDAAIADTDGADSVPGNFEGKAKSKVVIVSGAHTTWSEPIADTWGLEKRLELSPGDGSGMAGGGVLVPSAELPLELNLAFVNERLVVEVLLPGAKGDESAGPQRMAMNVTVGTDQQSCDEMSSGGAGVLSSSNDSDPIAGLFKQEPGSSLFVGRCIRGFSESEQLVDVEINIAPQDQSDVGRKWRWRWTGDVLVHRPNG